MRVEQFFSGKFQLENLQAMLSQESQSQEMKLNLYPDLWKRQK